MMVWISGRLVVYMYFISELPFSDYESFFRDVCLQPEHRKFAGAFAGGKTSVLKSLKGQLRK